jgi:hypothetical protein
MSPALSVGRVGSGYTSSALSIWSVSRTDGGRHGASMDCSCSFLSKSCWFIVHPMFRQPKHWVRAPTSRGTAQKYSSHAIHIQPHRPSSYRMTSQPTSRDRVADLWGSRGRGFKSLRPENNRPRRRVAWVRVGGGSTGRAEATSKPLAAYQPHNGGTAHGPAGPTSDVKDLPTADIWTRRVRM